MPRSYKWQALRIPDYVEDWCSTVFNSLYDVWLPHVPKNLPEVDMSKLNFNQAARFVFFGNADIRRLIQEMTLVLQSRVYGRAPHVCSRLQVPQSQTLGGRPFLYMYVPNLTGLPGKDRHRYTPSLARMIMFGTRMLDTPLHLFSFLTGLLETSHVCGREDCTNPSHLVVEDPATNKVRKNCHSKLQDPTMHYKCKKHFPPCFWCPEAEVLAAVPVEIDE